MKKNTKAVILNIFNPGLGFIYIGQVKAAIITYILMAFTTISMIKLNLSISIQYLGFSIMVIYILIYYITLCLITIKKSYKSSTKKNKTFLCLIYLVLNTLVITPVIIKILNKTLFQTFTVPSTEMSPTIGKKDKVISNNSIYKYVNPSRLDIIVFYYSDNANIPYLSRVIGLPDDNIEIRNNSLYINDLKVNESYINLDFNIIYDNSIDTDTYNRLSNFSITVPQDCYFVLGDNRFNSNDSRFKGFIKKENIIGKVEKIYWSKTIERLDKAF